MRLVTYTHRDQPDAGARAGVLRDGRVVDAWGLLEDADAAPPPGCAPASVRRLLIEERLGELSVAIAESEEERTRASFEMGSVELGVPIPDPEKIICIGLNYHAHAAEAGLDPPPVPTFFAKFRNALARPDATVTVPAASQKCDYEAEVAFVIGRRAHEVGLAEALDHIAGYTLLNDLSARDLQFATPQWIPGKVFDGSAPCGPALVTPDDAGAADSIEISLDLNGERMQDGSTADLVFGVAELVAHLSTLMTLEPGDIVSTGTPAGVGSVRTPRVWLQDGDRIEISSPTLGRLGTTIAR